MTDDESAFREDVAAKERMYEDEARREAVTVLEGTGQMGCRAEDGQVVLDLGGALHETLRTEAGVEAIDLSMTPEAALNLSMALMAAAAEASQSDG